VILPVCDTVLSSSCQTHDYDSHPNWKSHFEPKEANMTLPLIPIISIIAGILILIAPKVLNYVVAIYLIVIGVVGLARFL